MVIKSKDLIELFDISSRTLSNWRKRGLSQKKRGSWDLKKVFQWWQKHIMPGKFANVQSLEDSKKIYWSSKGLREKLQLSIDRGELISKASVEKDAFEMGRAVRDALQNIPSRVSAVLAATKTEAEIEKILDKEIRQALESLSK